MRDARPWMAMARVEGNADRVYYGLPAAVLIIGALVVERGIRA